MSTATVTQAGPLDRELAFTETYKRYLHEHVAVREAMCLRSGRSVGPIRPGDLFAGRHVKAALDPRGQLVGFGLEPEDCGVLYYCDFGRLRRVIAELAAGSDYRRRAEEMLAFWEQEATVNCYLDALPDEVCRATTNKLAEKGIRLAGAMLDFDKLVRVGLPGLREEVDGHRAAAEAGDGRAPKLYEGMLVALDLLADVALDYAEQAERLAGRPEGIEHEADLRRMAADLRAITTEPPRTLAQGIQLFWLYAVMAGVTNFGRMDVYLGDLLADDLDSGRLTEAEALRLLKGLWRLIAHAQFHFNSRVIVGGRGRRNEQNADRFALSAMQASFECADTEPQLSLRFHEAMNPALMRKALDVIGQGCVYPILYNDDVNVPAVAHAFSVGRQEAERYLPIGCGEYVLDHLSVGSPNTGFNFLKCVQVVMHDGVDPDSGEEIGLKTGPFGQLATFEQCWDAYCRQVDYHMAMVARAHVVEYEVERSAACFLYASMLYDGCLEKGRSVVDRGPPYTGGVVESMALVNAADSLTAIKKLVYDERRFTPEQLLRMLEADWAGYERERKLFVDAPKYGNDDEQADGMLCRVSEQACRSCRAQAEKVGLDYFLLVCINNYVHVTIGKETGATPDGRKAGSPTANGNGPTAGYDRCGVTAFLNSIVKPDPTIHAGYVHNMKFGKRMFREHRPKLEALLDTYFANGGTQAMITVVGRGDLENAMREPEKYRSLMVRVGGFSARFVELDSAIQEDLLRRTLYD